MFSTLKTNKSGAKGEHTLSIVSYGTSLIGNFTSESDLHVDGRIEGSVRARAVLLGDRADVIGDIVCETIEVRGKVKGTIDAQTVTLGRHSHVEGEILYKTIDVAGGAFLSANCKQRETIDDESDKAKAEEEAASKAGGRNLEIVSSAS